MKRLFLLLLVLTACSKSGGNDPFQTYDRQALLNNLATQVITPGFQVFQTKATDLTALAKVFAAAPSEAALTASRDAWKAALDSYKAMMVFRQGPIEDHFWEGTIDFNAFNATALENAITAGGTVDSGIIENKPSTIKGLPALEYLLFRADAATVVAQFRQQPARAAFLIALAQNLQDKSKAITDAWTDWSATFRSADGRDINSSLGVLSNKMVDLIYTIRDEHVGLPLGRRNSGTPQPAAVPYGLSESSIRVILQEIRSIETAFLGRSPSGQNGTGIDDLLSYLNAQSSSGTPLTQRINEQFATVYAKLDALQGPLQTSVVSEKDKVQALYDEIKKLQVLLEVDMVNNLGVLLTFSDNDGD